MNRVRTPIDGSGIMQVPVALGPAGRCVAAALLLVIAIPAQAFTWTAPFEAGAAGPPDASVALRDPYVLISLDHRRLWLISGRDTLISAPIAIGKGTTFSYRGRRYDFRTPRGERRVLAKEIDPIWTPPDWHYFERAVRQGLEPVLLEKGQIHDLEDGTSIEVRGDEVGRVNQYGNFWPFTPGAEIIFYGRIFVPPFGTRQRRIPDALGTRKLDLGDGYLIHGTHEYNRETIGSAASHGCIRMRNEDVERLYRLVPVGTRVVIR